MDSILFKTYCSEEYLLQKVGAYYEACEGDRTGAKQVIEFMASLIVPTTVDIPVADETLERTKLSPEQIATVDEWIKVGLKQINREFPLVAGESIITDTFTFLTTNFMSYPERTPVLVRETNKATMIHFFSCSVYHNGNIEPSNQLRETPIQVPSPQYTVLMGLMGVESIVFSLFSKIISAIVDKSAARIFDEIFPDSDNMAKMLQDLQDNIKTIFRQELDEQTINDLNLKVQGVCQYMKETYLLQKKGGADVKKLEGLLIQQNEKMYTELMALLTGERYRAKGIAYLVAGSAAHLGILQELAQITSQSDPKVSKAYVDNYNVRLDQYIQALKSAIYEVHQSRLNYLSPCQQSALKGVSTERWWFVDNWANYTSEMYGNTYSFENKKYGGDGYTIDAYQKANNARNDYYNKTFHPKIEEDLKIYVDVKNAWEQARM